MIDYPTHRAFIKAEFEVIAETSNAILFVAYGELCCEIGNASFDCHSEEDFWEMVELFGNDNFDE